MPRFALINTSDSSFLELRDFASTPADPAGKARKWLPCDPVTQPSFDPLTEKLGPATYTVGASAVTEVWTKVSLTSQEISDRKDSAVSSINGGGYSPVLKALFNLNNRVLTLEGKSTLTLPQFKAAIKVLL